MRCHRGQVRPFWPSIMIETSMRRGILCPEVLEDAHEPGIDEDAGTQPPDEIPGHAAVTEVAQQQQHAYRGEDHAPHRIPAAHRRYLPRISNPPTPSRARMSIRIAALSHALFTCSSSPRCVKPGSVSLLVTPLRARTRTPTPSGTVTIMRPTPPSISTSVRSRPGPASDVREGGAPLPERDRDSARPGTHIHVSLQAAEVERCASGAGRNAQVDRNPAAQGDVPVVGPP